MDVHFYSGTIPTPYSIDVVLNETDNTSRLYHYKSVKSLPSSNSSEHGEDGSGDSRFNNILSVKCGSQKICSISFVDNEKLSSDNNTPSQPDIIHTHQKGNLNFRNTYQRCIHEYQKGLHKKDFVEWYCGDKGRKIWKY